MAFTNSSLVSYTRISPNKNEGRYDYYTNPNNPTPITKITKITVHHIAGVATVESFGNIVANPNREMSANYAIGNDGRIGLYCEEKDRSWCSSSRWNDNQAITIEVSNSSVGGDWPVSDTAYESLIKLCIDICKRNDIKKLEYTGDKNGSLTIHSMFSQTLCPGPYLKSKLNDICARVNDAIVEKPSPTPTPAPAPTPVASDVRVGDLVKIKSGAKYYNGGTIPGWVANDSWYISSISGDRAILGKNQSGKNNIQSPVKASDVIVISRSNSNAQTVTLEGSAVIYDKPGGRSVSTVGSKGVYTIVETQTTAGATYGKLKSGAGWVILSGNAPNTDIKAGDTVKVINPIIYGTNKKFVVYVSTYKVLEVSGDRCVISADGKNVTSAVAKKNLQKV